ncbi:MAG: 50S ribosomal protein L9 [Planctomycetota bacterium]
MKVLLCQDVKLLGWLGDVVEVNTGYARNYLLPQGLAKPATEGNLRAIAKEKALRAEQRITGRKRLEEAAAAVEGAEAVVAAKANEQGILFGSVGAGEIATNLREQGFEVADEVVQLPEHIKNVGTHSVTLKFADDFTATVSVVVVPEGGDVADVKAAESEGSAEQKEVENKDDQSRQEPQQGDEEVTPGKKQGR